MNIHHGPQLALAFSIALAGCAPAPERTETAASVEPSVPNAASASPSEPAVSFPTAAFADIREDPVSEEVAAEFQAILSDMAGRSGMAATVMSADGTWSGATGKADGVRDVRVDDQFAIASVTKSLIAAQVMQMVEAGELGLDDPASDHLPPDLDFDTNGATIVDLLSHRSGFPETLEGPGEWESFTTDPLHVWTPDEVLATVGPERGPVGQAFEYRGTNYVLLGLIVEHVTGRPLAEVLRSGVLAGDGYERLIYQPDERPTDPMAMPYGSSADTLDDVGGYLPSLAAATAFSSEGAMASDSPSLARWWRAFCAGEVVSEASLTEMSTFHDGYGLGLSDVADPYARGVGHTGGGVGYVAWAGCLPEYGAVVVVLHNRVVEDIGGMARPLVNAVIAARSD
jgi:CubicO group peptidase (beta-lactamase class C family)